MSLDLSKKLSAIKPSLTLAITAKARQMLQAGLPVISFSAGEPDFETPLAVRQAGIDAINKGFTRYTPSCGIIELKQAIVDKLKRDNGLDYSTAQVAVSGGAKHSLYNLFQAILNPGDEVVIPAPYWVSYPDMVQLADGVPVVVHTEAENNFELTVADLEKHVTARTKAIVLNSPSNPTGAVYHKERLLELAKWLEQRDIYVISDEIYEYFVYDDAEFVSIAALSPKLKEKTIVINGVSKSYSMTGWRIGYMAAPEAIIKLVDTIQSQSLSNPTSVAQYAAIEAISGDQTPVAEMLAAFDERRQFMVKALCAIPGVECVAPQGAFYAFPKVSSLYGKSYNGKLISGSIDFAEALLEAKHVAVVPGAGFGDDNFIRLSYACSMTNIQQGLERLAQFVGEFG